MSVSVKAHADGVSIEYRTTRDGANTLVVCTAEDLRNAVRLLVSRFGEMQEDCVEQLDRVGIKVRLDDGDSTPEAMS